ncbi:hypothetical protein IC762_22460 [Bradyrhizobium genosp. L]|uniref:hypothetical protein n=1 Tax=Bradyrhizobium genosp. L TaxID=83637 RepID=UPI0018A3337C|nr:hypothetical protein [Bradyrhizobium genosp. L]QPF82511.1 hypothetical protein IC762_22460 [Bradyrhizobium genosp. L]
MRVRQASHPILLLSAFMLLSLTAAGVVAALDPVSAPDAKPAAVSVVNQTPVRIIGTPFIPNTNPRQR